MRKSFWGQPVSPVQKFFRAVAAVVGAGVVIASGYYAFHAFNPYRVIKSEPIQRLACDGGPIEGERFLLANGICGESGRVVRGDGRNVAGLNLVKYPDGSLYVHEWSLRTGVQEYTLSGKPQPSSEDDNSKRTLCDLSRYERLEEFANKYKYALN